LKTLPRGTAILQGGGDHAADGGGVGGRRGDWRRQGREEGTKMEVAYRVFQLNHIKRTWATQPSPHVRRYERATELFFLRLAAPLTTSDGNGPGPTYRGFVSLRFF
jgi:hypothetical protein